MFFCILVDDLRREEKKMKNNGEKEKMNSLIKKVITIALTLVITTFIISGCSYVEVDTKTIVDYRFTPFHEEERVGYSRKYDVIAEEWYNEPYKYTVYVPEKYELLWEYTYMDGHYERQWEDCTRFEYQNAKEELGDDE